MVSDSWASKNWRSWSAFVYLIINVCDFIVFPSVSWWWAHYSSTPYLAWQPLTLIGGGMFHLSFGALLTATSWSKSKEKIMGTSTTTDDTTTK